jgi:tetratricopeptide (TPR) repeat protein
MTKAQRIVVFLAFCATMAQLHGRAQNAPPTSAQSSSNTSDSQFAHARQLAQQGKYDEAIAELQRLSLSLSERQRKGLARDLGIAYYKKADYARAVDSFKQALQENPKDLESIQMLGLSYYLGGHAAEAIPFLQQVQTWYPRANVDAAYVLGQCYIQTKDYSHARQAFARMFDLPEDSAASYLLTARMLFRQEFVPIAQEYVEKAITLDPKLPLAHFLLGEIHLFASQVQEAINDFKAELTLNPENAGTYYKLADAYSRIQNFEDAERMLQRSIWLDPTATGPYVLMGKVLKRKGEPDLAVRALQRAATMDPNNAMTHHLLGQAYRDLGNEEAAQRELNLAVRLQSSQSTQP